MGPPINGQKSMGFAWGDVIPDPVVYCVATGEVQNCDSKLEEGQYEDVVFDPFNPLEAVILLAWEKLQRPFSRIIFR